MNGPVPISVLCPSFMLDKLTHLFAGARPIDVAMLVIELLVLLLILFEFIWKVVDWRRVRRAFKTHEGALKQRLATLTPSEGDGLERLALDGQLPTAEL